MNRKISLVVLPLLLITLYIAFSSSSGGITGQSVAGCTCHGSTSASTLVSITGLPAGGYVNGVVYPITVSVTNTVITGTSPFGLRDGFSLRASSGTFTAVAGTFYNAPTNEIGHNTPKVPTAGTASWTFNWTAPASGTANVTFNLSGNATNGNGNTAGDQWNQTSVTIIRNGTPLSVSATAPAISCAGGTSTITATGSGGSLPYQYRLNAGAFGSNNTFSGVGAGTYTITVRDAILATATSVVTLTAPSAITASATFTPILCNGGTSNITASGTGGTGAYTYRLNTGAFQSSPLFSNRTAGNYTITVRDANLCTATTTLAITQPTLMSFTAPSITPPPCNGGTGSMTITATGGTGSKSYSIQPLGPQTNSSGTFSNLSSQIYTVTVQDANNCTRTTTVNITQPTALNFSSPTITPPLCHGGTGQIQVNASGGTGTKTYTIQPNGPQSNTSGLFISLTAGIYTITVTDANSCTTNTIVTLNQPNPIPVSTFDINGCTGVPLTLTGSPAGGSFSIPNPYNGPGTSFVYTYTDGNGCQGSDTAHVHRQDLVLENAISAPDVICPGAKTLVSVKPQNFRCIPQTGNTACSGIEFINQVSLAGIDHLSACNGIGYNDYTSLTPIPIQAGQSYPLLLGDGGFFNGDFWNIWIDYNQNDVFEQEGEYLGFPAAGPLTGSTISIPTNALNGITKMRVRLVWLGPFSPCDVSSWGETEDYSVLISGGQNPSLPAFTYSWSSAPTAGFSQPNQRITEVLGLSQTTTYTVTATSALGCTATATTLTYVLPADLIDNVTASPSFVCPGDSSTLSVTPIQSGINYCTANHINIDCNTEYIQQVIFNTINHTTVCDSIDYKDYTNISTQVNAGTFVPITLVNANHFFGDYWKVFIDFNQDGDFLDIYEEQRFEPYAPITNGQIFIPNSAYNGSTRMRIRLTFSGQGVSACGITLWGETEDYTLIINGGQPLPPYLSYQWSNNLNSVLQNTNQPTTMASQIMNTENYRIQLQNRDNCSSTDSVTVQIQCGALLGMKLYLQGYYTGGGLMNPVLLNQGVSTDALLTDSITIELRDTVAPYAVIYSQQVPLSTLGMASATLPVSGYYYLVVKHRNTLQTWSAQPLALSGTVFYDFSFSGNQAFAQNMLEIEPGVWCLYSGDINQDENTDLLDSGLLETDISNFAFGYFTTDLNGDGNVDLLDLAPLEYNINNFVFSQHP